MGVRLTRDIGYTNHWSMGRPTWHVRGAVGSKGWGIDYMFLIYIFQYTTTLYDNGTGMNICWHWQVVYIWQLTTIQLSFWFQPLHCITTSSIMRCMLKSVNVTAAILGESPWKPKCRLFKPIKFENVDRTFLSNIAIWICVLPYRKRYDLHNRITIYIWPWQ